MTIPPRFLEELRSRLTLSEIIGQKVSLTRAGREFKACCPFHNEKTASFTVNDDKQFYHCFGCGAHGSVIDFAMQMENLSFIEAVEVLAAQAGMQVPQASPQEVARAKKQKDIHALLEEATRWMEQQLRAPANRAAYDYMIGRGVPEDLLGAFRVGFAPEDPQAIWQYLLAQGYTEAQMLEAGVLRPSKKGREPYAFFRGRIMFPVTDRRGRVVAFGGRILPDHLRPPDRGDYVPAKYMNSGDTPLFDKGRMLYGAPQAAQAAQDGQPLLVVEGYLDVMACCRAGFRGAVAPLGTALTEDQILLAWRMIPGEEKVPILCFDGDKAGRSAASRAADRLLPLLKPNHSARIAFLPEGEDPDTLITGQGAKAFQAVLESAMSLADFFWLNQTQGRSFNTPESRAGLSRMLEDEAGRIQDRDVQHYYRQAFREKIREAFGYKPADGKKSYTVRQGEKKGAMPGMRRPAYSRERLTPDVLLAACINHPCIFEEIEEPFAALQMGDKGLDRLHRTVLSTLAHDSKLDAEGLSKILLAEGCEEDLKRVLSEAIYTHAAFARPSTEEGRVLAEFKRTLDEIEKSREREEFESAGTRLIQDLNPENEDRIMALHPLRKSSDG